MSVNKRKYFFEKIIPYVDIYSDNNKNNKLLVSIIYSFTDECFLTVMSEIDNFLKRMNDNDRFESLYSYFISFNEKRLAIEVIDTAASFNKRAKVFKEYFLARKYGYVVNNKNGKEIILQTIDYYMSLGTTKKDILSFTNILGSAFNTYKEEILDYIDRAVYIDSENKNNVLITSRKKALGA